MELQPLDVAINALAFISGLLIGHWLARAEARRKELNEAAQPVRRWLLEEIAAPSPYSQGPTLEELDAFIQCLPFWERGRFNRGWKQQCAARQQAERKGAMNEILYPEPKALIATLRRCLEFTRKR